MENTKQVGKQALNYRIAVNEGFGIVISVALTIIVALILSIIKFKNGMEIDLLFFLSIFIIQFVFIYFTSLLQYKNLKYNIGQNAITFQKGAFSSEIETVPFEKIKSAIFDQTLIQKFFSVGDITIDQEDEKYTWDNIDSETASLISNSVSVKGDVQPITVAQANAVVTSLPPTK